jgi:AcrR family transcriptional regulator
MKPAAPDPSTREQIVAAADDLFYKRGFEKTSFADIADRVGISRGNFYHHFKAKDDILAAVIARRAEATDAMLAAWSTKAPTPLDRLGRFARMLVDNRKDIQRHGCPVGTLCAELAKLAHPSRGEAGMIFGQFRAWLRAQFEALGRVDDADALALHLLARSQGIAAMANAIHDEAFIRREVEALDDWLRSQTPRGRRH